jgi:DNA-binding Xre family transcriptional regulator
MKIELGKLHDKIKTESLKKIKAFKKISTENLRNVIDIAGAAVNDLKKNNLSNT